MSNSDYICETENIAAYIDGDLEPGLRSALEEHIKQCAHCASELQAQRLFMCELDSALASPFDLAVPANFAQVVAVHAESDMRGMRDRGRAQKGLAVLHNSWVWQPLHCSASLQAKPSSSTYDRLPVRCLEFWVSLRRPSSMPRPGSQ